MIDPGMYPYYFLFLIIVVSSYSFDILLSAKTSKWTLFFLFVFVLAVFAGTRIGWNDQEIYEWVYKMVPPFPDFLCAGSSIKFREEYFFIILNSIVKCFSDDPTSMFLTAAFLSVTVNLFVYKKYSPFFILSILFYFSTVYFAREMMQVRMGIACALVLLSMTFLIEKKWKHFVVMILVASLFHVSSLFVFFGYVLYWLRPKTYILFLLIVIAFIAGFFAPLAYKIFEILLTANRDSSLLARGMGYYGNTVYGYALGVFKPTTFKQLAICLLAMRFRGSLSRRLEGFDVFFVFYCASVIWILLFNDMAIVSVRGGDVLSVGEPLLFASFLLLFGPAYRSMVAVFFYIICFLAFHLGITVVGYPQYISVLF